MTKSTITREQLEEWVAQFDEDGGCDATDRQLEALIRQSLAALDSEPVAYTDEAELCFVNDMACMWTKGMGINEVPLYRHAQPAPVVQKTAHSSVIAEQLANVLSEMKVTDHQRAVISCAVDRLNNVAQLLQLSPSALLVPEILDYQGAKELYNYLMTEEETNATVNGWNACRAAMLKAQPQNAPLNIPEIIPGWIPVSERMPIEFEAVIAFDGDQVYGEAMYSSDDGFTIDGYEPCDRLNLQNVTHWMPLPAAPEEVK